jgi:hypothetical protein|tara:strand:- start:388 stop:618 length:231 start_codon:yes stop_codon:yes gene_type:complete
MTDKEIELTAEVKRLTEQLRIASVSKRNLLNTDVKCKHPSGTRKGKLQYDDDGETLILKYKGGFINIPDLSNCYVC